MKHYKVYINLYDKNNKRIEQEEKKQIVKKLIEQDKKTFWRNLNKTQDEHYPFYYDSIYYFGEPIVLTAISEDKLTELLTFFKEQNLKFWIPYLYEMVTFKELNLKGFRMENINQEREFLFLNKNNLVNEYKNHYAVIQDNTTIAKVIKATE